METNLAIIRGDTVPLTINVMNGAVPLNITGYKLLFTAKGNKSDSDAAAVITKKVTVHINPTAGISEIVLSASDTTLQPREYFYDIRIISLTGLVTTLFHGKLTVTQNITIRTE